MLSLKVMFVLIFFLLSIKDTTIAHDQVKEKIVIVDEAGNGIVKVGRNHLINDDKEVYDGHYVPASIKVQVIGRGRKEMEGNRASLMDFTAADYHTATTHPPRNN
ncbi:uncharacterized protein LOC129901033 [Solanum dulcamara]|uniref:uncharacterized protein LOC129901033 n=1 Tax=Solanum dulcamara TaxID=45834 RepID=UPI002484F2EC|nr:uncharacterized protein LOC129901033 [Solanum dulcamara]